ncbi:MAG: replicative DNA helicase [Roseburia sp.]|nr:replicative DNA helicase [Roseburia sp.]
MPKREDREEFVKKHPNVTTREMPNSYEAEAALVGGMLIDAQTASKFLPELSADDFYTPKHKLLYEAMNDLFNAAQPIDMVTVVGQLDKRGALEQCGVDYVAKLVDAVPSVANAEYYYNIVKKNSRLRALIGIARQMADEAYALDPDDTALTRAEAALYALAETGRRVKPELLGGYLDEVLDDLRRRAEARGVFRGVPTGFTKFDTLLGGGFQKSDLIILAARPGQGKTSFAMNCAVNAALSVRADTKQPFSVAVFSLEMSAVQLAKRILCSVGNYDMTRANSAIVNESDWRKLFDAQDKLSKTRLYIDESGDITPAEILSKCRALKHSVGLDFVMIDYLQLMHSGSRMDNFVREVAEMTRALKLAAKELDVPILLLSQMSRSIEQRKGDAKEARLSDLRDSGAIEQDADIVLFLDKKDGAEGGDDKSQSAPRPVSLIIAKHRNGAMGRVPLIWSPATVTFKGDDVPEPPTNSSGRNPKLAPDISDYDTDGDDDDAAPPDAANYF